MILIHNQQLTVPLASVPPLPVLQAGDVVITDTQSGVLRITGRLYRRTKLAGAWSMELLGYVGESLNHSTPQVP